MDSVRCIIVSAVLRGWKPHQFDAVTALLHGDVDSSIYMELPEGFEELGYVCRLRRSLYGLKQAPRIWYQCVQRVLAARGFTMAQSDNCVFYKSNCVICVYVDDFLVAAAESHEIDQVQRALETEFQLQIIESQQVQVGPMGRWSVHVAELIGIFYAVGTVFKINHQRPRTENGETMYATILCDSRSALQAIQNPGNKSGQRIIHAILQAATEVQTSGIALCLQWIPGHCDNPGNDTTDRLAKEAASPGKTHPFRPLLTRKRALIRDKTHAQWEREWKASTKGGHLRKIDNTLPATYTRKLYGNLPRGRAYLLTQLRTAHNWLSTYAKTFGFRYNDQCVCGAQETVTHVLVDYPNLREIRRDLRPEAGDAFNDVSSLLGGSTEGKRGKPDIVSRARTVKAVLDFAEVSQRFKSRAP
ncbi:hypothetical protein VN97_g9328 [Penicillium thymicola]|uniref:Reverse transcriptase Ty1/copia-type domain-containing protein n=1 Tax=Penicillium thymicola TaxID=293382 RepID=A0AAI9X4W3_PENTH|nr:hypothetical protein VN97_g9328 [Penicillium thymicola]